MTFLARLQLPGATPDLLLLVVVSLALAYGPGFGRAVGFGAGLAADLAPPADHAVGRWALVLSLVGYLAGAAARRDAGGRPSCRCVVVGVAAAASVLLYAGLGALMDDPHITWDAVVALLPTAVLYDVVLSAVRRARRPRAGQPGRAGPRHVRRGADRVSERSRGCGWSSCRCWCCRCW